MEQKRYKTILVDDEKNNREVLRKLLEMKHPEIEVLAEAASVDEAYELCINLKPQLLFLDIQMPRANGFSLLKKFNEIPFEVIFVTGFDQYAITAIKFNALDYLLKPVELADLASAVKKAGKIIEQKKSRETQLINLLNSLDDENSEKKITVHIADKVKILNSGNILYIEGDGRYSKITTVHSETYVLPKNLKNFEEYLGPKSRFIRISKTYLINASQIKEYLKGEPFIIIMSNNKSFEVSRRKKSEVLAKIMANL